MGGYSIADLALIITFPMLIHIPKLWFSIISLKMTFMGKLTALFCINSDIFIIMIILVLSNSRTLHSPFEYPAVDKFESSVLLREGDVLKLNMVMSNP